MIISVVFVSMMVVFVTVYYFVTKPKKQQEKIYSAMTTDELIRFVQSMHCELVKSKGGETMRGKVRSV